MQFKMGLLRSSCVDGVEFPERRGPGLTRHDTDLMFARRLLTAAAVFAGLYLIWQLGFVLLLLFASILVATLLSGLTDLLARHSFLSRPWALVATAGGLLVCLGAFLFLFGSQLVSQLTHVFEGAPGAIDAAGRWIGVSNAADRLTETLSQSGTRYFFQAANVGYSVMSGLGQLALVMVAAVYLAANPALYRNGLAKLFPARMQKHVLETFTLVGSALRLWFLSQLLSMLLVGVLSAVAYSIIGLPIPIGLGAIAGITNFIPIVGPFIGSLPAVLFAFTLDGGAVAWTVLAVFIIQQIDGYVAMPLIQRQVVAMPPALLLYALVALGILFGWLGVILAAPITVAVMVLVQKLWVREIMGEPVKIPGEASKAK